MLRFFIVFCLFLFPGIDVLAGFTTPTNDPPLNNVPAPLMVGESLQVKSGDLETNNFEALEFINLGGITKNQWPSDTATSGCNWLGTKCYCRSNGSSAGNVRATIGVTCDKAGFVTDYRIYGFEISSQPKYCEDVFPKECDRRFSVYSDDHTQESIPARIIGNIISGVRSTITNVVSSVRRIWNSWF